MATETEKLRKLMEAADASLKSAFEHGTKAKGYAQKGDAASAGYHATKSLYDISATQAGIVAAVNALPELIAMARRVESFDYLRPEVQAFARRMEDALRRKDSERGGNSWQKQTLAEEILPHLQERADRIHHYLKQASKYRQRSDEFMEQMETDNAAEQAVHAANFAMMLADICVPLARTALKEKIS